MMTKKLTPRLLKKIIEEEVAKFGDMENVEDKAGDTEEVEADEQADSLEKHINYVKALKIEETRLMKRLSMIKEQRQKILKKITAKIA